MIVGGGVVIVEGVLEVEGQASMEKNSVTQSVGNSMSEQSTALVIQESVGVGDGVVMIRVGGVEVMIGVGGVVGFEEVGGNIIEHSTWKYESEHVVWTCLLPRPGRAALLAGGTVLHTVVLLKHPG